MLMDFAIFQFIKNIYSFIFLLLLTEHVSTVLEIIRQHFVGKESLHIWIWMSHSNQMDIYLEICAEDN